MKLDFKSNKGFRLLSINERLNKGEVLSKSLLSFEYGVTEKTIQRDIDDLRAYYAETKSDKSEDLIKYDKIRKGYFFNRIDKEGLTNEEVLALCKIILESRALCMNELNTLLSKLLAQTSSNHRKLVEEIVRNEHFCYVPLKHNKEMIQSIWTLSRHIVNHEIIKVTYKRKDGVEREHDINPVAIMFSEYYFYLIAFLSDDSKDYPTVFRIDRIENIQCLNRKFKIPYKDKFNDGEFRKRVQFMYSGPLRKVNFEYSGQSIESVLDKLPTAEIISSEVQKYIVRCEVYGDGIDMWLRSQGNNVRVIL